MTKKINADAEYASGAVKENVGYVVGSENLQGQGKAQKGKGDADYDAANAQRRAADHETDNTEAKREPSKTTGQLHAVKGSVKETLGSMLKNENLENTGANERRAGNREVEAVKTRNLAEGAGGRVKGTVKENVGYATGNPQMEAEGKGENIRGQAQYRANQ